MTKPQLEGLLKSYQVRCRGTDGDSNPVLPQTEKEQAIVEVFRDGHTRVLCRYYQSGMYVAGCNAQRIPKIDTGDELGICPYAVPEKKA